MGLVDSGSGGFIFLDAPGGTGKTFLLNTILAKVRLGGKIALASASSGIGTGDVRSSRFAAHLLRIGNGNVPSDHEDIIAIPRGVGTSKAWRTSRKLFTRI